jgi:basic membrane protein A
VRAHALQIEQRDEERDLHNRSFFFALAQQTDARLRGSEQEMWSVLLEGDVALVRETLLRGFRSHAWEQGAFLAGAAAALKSRSGRVGYIGGVKTDQLETFQAGYEAGARHVDPSVSLDAAYLSQAPDFSGFWQPRAAKRKAIEMYGRGADVIFHAAGPAAGGGVFEAAREVSERSGHRWVIGVDFDEYLQVEDELRPHVLTSMRLQVPVAVYRRIREAVENGDASNPRFDLASEGVGLSASGGYLDDVSEDLEQLRQQIVAGQIRVPTTPAAQTRRGPVGPKR